MTWALLSAARRMARADVGIGADALRIERFQRQNLDIRGQPGHAHAVVGRGRDDAGHVRAVAIVVARVKIPVDVVIPRRQTPGELGMREIDAGVDHRHHEGIGAEGEIPRRGRATRRMCHWLPMYGSLG